MNRALVESGDAQGDEWTIDQNNRNAVLGEGPRVSGGRRHELTVATGLSKALEAVASDLLNQYAVVYEAGAGTKPTRKLSVAVKRRGVTVRAPIQMRSRRKAREHGEEQVDTPRRCMVRARGAGVGPRACDTRGRRKIGEDSDGALAQRTRT